MATNTIRLHRVLRTTPAKVYRAFTEPGRWQPVGSLRLLHPSQAQSSPALRWACSPKPSNPRTPPHPPRNCRTPSSCKAGA